MPASVLVLLRPKNIVVTYERTLDSVLQDVVFVT